ncbi:glycosyltransferase [Clostridium botulinum]|nr:glycosyltransferase [Clostridium botulinum]
MKISIIIPCYNEEENVEELVLKLAGIYNMNNDINFILVNNGSKDKTYELLNKYSKQYTFIKIINVEINQGYGYGLISGLKFSDGDFVGWIHADMQLDPINLINVTNKLKENNYDKNIFIKGKRNGRPLLDNIFTFGMSLFETILFKKRIHDIGAIPVLFYKDMIKYIDGAPKDFSIELYFYCIAKKLGKKIIRVPIILNERKAGKSSWNTGIISKFKQSFRIIKASLNIKKNLS